MLTIGIVITLFGIQICSDRRDERNRIERNLRTLGACVHSDDYAVLGGREGEEAKGRREATDTTNEQARWSREVGR